MLVNLSDIGLMPRFVSMKLINLSIEGPHIEYEFLTVPLNIADTNCNLYYVQEYINFHLHLLVLILCFPSVR